MRGRPRLRYCPKNHDKWLPGGIHLYVQLVHGREYRRRLCKKCMDERNTRRREGVREQTRKLKETCKYGHSLINPENLFYIERKYVAVTGKAVYYKIRSCKACQQTRDVNLRRKNKTEKQWERMIAMAHKEMERSLKPKDVFEPIPPKEVFNLEKFLAMPPRRIHTVIPFERRAM